MAFRAKRGDVGVGTYAVGLAAGAAVAYFFDPQNGRERRDRIRERGARAWQNAREQLATSGAGLRQHAREVLDETAKRVRRETSGNGGLERRIRSQLARISAYPHAILVSSADGAVRLTGHVLRHELEALLQGIGAVDGVQHVINELQVLDDPNTLSDLQAEARTLWSEFRQQWPAARLLYTAAGASLIAYALGRRSWARSLLGLGGAALVARGVVNRPLAELWTTRARRNGIDIKKVIRVYAPVEEVYAFWEQLENFPKFMSHVREVTQLQDDRYHWKVDGPAGVAVEWDAQMTDRIPGQLLAWRSVEGATVDSEGSIRFEADPYGGTRLEVRLSYSPPAGAVGHAVAKLLGVDPKKQMDEDLQRFKSYIEVGVPETQDVATRH